MTSFDIMLPYEGAKPLTMSSREIAELVEKRHDNVKRTIETLADRGVIEFPQSEEMSTATKPVTIYHLGKRDTLVVVAQLSPEFTARVVDRWQQLEADVMNPAALLAQALSDPKQARALLLQQVEKNEELQATVEAQKVELVGMAPKASAYDHIANCEGLLNIRQAAKTLQVPERKFIEWLKANGWVYRSPSAGSAGRLLGYSDRERSGHLTHRHHTYRNSHGEDAVATQVFITAKGMQLLAKRFGGGTGELPLLA